MPLVLTQACRQSRSEVATRQPRVLVAQLGARRHYAVPRALASVACLERVVTDACAQVAPWSIAARLPGRWRKGFLAKIGNRQIEGVDAAQVQGCLRFDLARRLGRLMRQPGEAHSDFWARQNEAFGRAASAGNWGAASTVYAFNGCALEVFQEARRRGLRCVLDQSAAPWRYNTALLRREQERWPGWEDRPADLDASGCMIEREEAEWALADRIVCGSMFVVDAIRAVDGPVEKTALVTYPTPAAPRVPRRPAGDGRTRVLFVGTLQLRKGIQYFSDVAGRLAGDRFEFRAVGPSLLTPWAERGIRDRVDWRGAVPRDRVWEQYGWADVFLLPTLSEGSANACLEAISSGLPVVTSPASGLADDDADWIAPGETAAIVAKLEGLASSPVDRRMDPACPARSIAEYGRDLLDAITQVN